MHEGPTADRAIARERFDEFFDRALEAHRRAELTCGGPARRSFRIAGAAIEFRLAHPGLAPVFCDALAHIEIPADGKPDFTFHIWDAASSGIDAPPACWSRDDLIVYGEIPAFIDAERYLLVDLDRAMVGAANRRLRKAAVWLRSPDHVAGLDRSAPLPTLLNWLASETGHFTVHAASVGRPEGGVLIVGQSGAGKSHTALACLDSDLLYVADDRCLLGTHGCPTSGSLYSTARLYETDLHRFPLLKASDAIHARDGKALFFLHPIAPEWLSPGFPIKAVLFPQPSGRRDTKVGPAPAGRALLCLGSDSALRSPSVGNTFLKRLAAVLRTVPCFRLETGTDMAQIPSTIVSLLDALPQAEAARGD